MVFYLTLRRCFLQWLTCGAVPWCPGDGHCVIRQMNFGHAFPVHVHARTKTLDHRQCHGITARRSLAELCRDFYRASGKQRLFCAADIQRTIRQWIPDVIRDTECPAQVIQQLVSRPVMGEMGIGLSLYGTSGTAMLIPLFSSSHPATSRSVGC